MKVLDINIGNGKLTKQLHGLGFKHILGIDQDPIKCEIANVELSHMKNVDF